MPPLFTAGHSTRTSPELVALLAAWGIELLVDVRRFPGSRRHPQFGHEALAAALAGAGIAYRHEADLGGRRLPRPDSPHTTWRVSAFRGYADYMETPAFAAALARLLDLAARRPTAILCAEAVPWRCHRRLIADAAVASGVEVRHILDPDRVESHHLDPSARLLPGGELVYDLPAGHSVPAAAGKGRSGGPAPLFENER
ncbi:MAG TPA: DUF488 domain-containing protein [Thermoanaerobaculia bacterium]|nr:DUF488 domain-containing protein [Thermoanaerobaculia bacterium]